VKRGVFDLLRRGLDNTVANWQVTGLRFLELILFFVLTIGGLVAILAPVLISAGINFGSLDTPGEFEGLLTLLLSKWMMVLWVFLGVLVLMTIWMLLHSFVEAGCVRVFVDADRIAGPELIGPRTRYRVFSFDRWLAGAKSGWWTIFWIYNVVWAVALLVLLIPLVPTAIGIVLLHKHEGAAVAIGCLGLAVTFFFLFLTMIVAALWCNRAIADWAVRGSGALKAVEDAWAEIRRDLGRHLLTALAIFVVSMTAGGFFSGISFMAGLTEAMGGDNKFFMFASIPVRILISLLNYAFSSAIASWFIATYAAIATDPHR